MHTQCWQMRLVVSLLVVLSALFGLPRDSPAHGVEFTCAAGDVACLIDAINQANANGEANTITLEAGTYTLTAVDNTTDGPNGLPSVTGTVTIQGAGGDITILERDAGAPPFRLVHVATTGTLTLEGLTLRGGSAGSGGGLLNQGGTVAIARTLFTGNRALSGGGLANYCGTATIAQTMFTGNFAGGSGGGGLINVFSSTPPGTGCPGAQVFITTTTFVGNTITAGGGSALNNGLGGIVTITQSSFVHNQAMAQPFASGTLNNEGAMFLQNTTLAGNGGGGGGGGLVNSAVGTAILMSTTVADNRAVPGRGRGAGLFNGVGGQLVLLNTILARNTVEGQGPDCFGPVTSLGTNLVGDPTGCTITFQPTDLTGDPGLGDFTDDGTPGNGHVPLLPGSQAIDAGNDAFCPPTDQLGQPRVGRCDIGAIEFQGKHHK
jgi:hypothetical protein